MNARNRKTLAKIITHIKRIQEYVKDVKSLDEFEKNSLKKDAIVFNLLQIGELSNKKLTNDFKKEHNTIPWIQIYGLRNRIVHDYDNIHSHIVYQVITHDLIELAEEIEALLD
jgi:uncharacterized protein with HEPN domain